MHSGTKRQPANRTPVTIQNRTGQVDRDTITLSISNADQAGWTAIVSGGFRIVFDGPEGSPFATDTFLVPNGGGVDSGVPLREGSFKYTVHGPDGHNDPVIIITR